MQLLVPRSSMPGHRCAVAIVVFLCALAASATSSPAVAATPDFEPLAAYLQKYCLACHGADDPQAGMSFAAFKQADDVVKHRRTWDAVTKILQAGNMPPIERVQPTADENAAFLAGIQAIQDEFEKNAPPNPGRVTMRRLNRSEYNRTLRDLFYGLDVNASEDFPSDDVGHGFDNIGDVLTMSPVLMERYLAAAEQVARIVIVPTVPKPTNRNFSIRYTQPSGKDVPLPGGFRMVVQKPDATPVESGPLYASFAMSPHDDYVFRFGAYAQPAGDEPVRIAAFAFGPNLVGGSTDEEIATLYGAALDRVRPLKILGTYEVTAREAGKSQNFEARVPAMPGITHVGVALLKSTTEPAAESEAAPVAENKLFVKYFTVEGPLDMRPYAMRRLMECSPDKSHDEQTREIITRFARRAYRRPPTDAEVARLAELVAGVEADGGKWEEGLQLAVQAVLSSPKFLFRAELDDRPTAAEPRPIDEFQLASRLSYFLWSSMPDDELFDLAAKGQLSRDLDAQVRRMLADPKSRSLIDEFAMQWLQLGRLKFHSPDPSLFPTFKEPLRQAMIKETQLFLEEIVRTDRPISDMLDADFTYLNKSLADHYGIADTAGSLKSEKKKNSGGKPFRNDSLWERVQLVDRTRGGLLTQAGFLTVTSNPTRTSPVKRGKWVLEQLLGEPPPPPPPNVPELEAQQGKLTGTLRQQMEQHRLNPACANCHAKMDPLGFAFENFDAVGAYRETDGDAPIDPSGTLPDGRSFNGPVELRAVMREYETEFARCLAEKLLTFALGRGLEYYDRRAVDQIVAEAKQNDLKFSALCSAIVRSEPFRRRTGLNASANSESANNEPVNNEPVNGVMP